MTLLPIRRWELGNNNKTSVRLRSVKCIGCLIVGFVAQQIQHTCLLRGPFEFCAHDRCRVHVTWIQTLLYCTTKSSSEGDREAPRLLYYLWGCYGVQEPSSRRYSCIPSTAFNAPYADCCTHRFFLRCLGCRAGAPQQGIAVCTTDHRHIPPYPKQGVWRAHMIQQRCSTAQHSGRVGSQAPCVACFVRVVCFGLRPACCSQ